MSSCSGIVPPEMDGKPIRIAAVYGIGISSGLYKQVKFHGRILLDGEEITRGVQVRAGQKLELFWPEKSAPVPEATTRRPSVLYEDEFLMVVDKPAPLPTAPSIHQTGETLENLVYTYLGKPESFVYRPVNRLDKGTSGIIVLAKEARSQERLQRLLHTEDFRREYLAVCEGCPPVEKGMINAPIAKEDTATVRRIVSESGKPAETEYEVVQWQNGRSLVHLRLHTGRTHQIRVHMAYVGCPVCGDFLYGTELKGLPGRFALHSAYLRLVHPMTGKKLELSSPLPEELENLLNMSTATEQQ